MKYVLEDEKESNRLKHQETISVYSLHNDMNDFEINPNDTVLDAGCGAGLISLYLRSNYKFKDLYSCDYSELRLMQARKFLHENGIYNTHFLNSDLSSIHCSDNFFSKIICRFVYEYLKDPQKVTAEFYRVCKPGGSVRLIDLDGVVVNLQTQNTELTGMLSVLKQISLAKYHLDFFAGRKLYAHMKRAGFTNIQCEVRPMFFNRIDIQKEKLNYTERFTFARNILEDAFGDKTQRFIDMYLHELENEENILFYNNFIVSGTKK